MARKRDVVIAVIIAVSFFVAMGFVALVFIGVLSGESDLGFASMGGDVGVIELFGVIDEASGREAIEQIDRWADHDAIKALVIHINSPGGGVAITQEIYDAVLRAREQKPVVGAMASIAASGGYYVACACDLIVANPGTLTGSIGVIFQYYTAEDLMKRIGVRQETVKAGQVKDVGSWSHDMNESEESMLQAAVNDTYAQFVEVVAEARNMDQDLVRTYADGSIYTGSQAHMSGLIDTLGGLNEAVRIAADMAGLEGDPEIVRPFERKRVSVWDLLGNVLGGIDQRIQGGLDGPKLMYLYR
ncbi:MAG: signal peptide peptidase SppA [bacterium]